MRTKQNYYSYTQQLLFGTLHFTTVLYTFFQNYYYLLMKLLFWKQKRTIGSYTNKKVLLSRDSPCFFPAFLLFDETLFLQIARTARHGFHVRNQVVAAFSASARSVNKTSSDIANEEIALWRMRLQPLPSHKNPLAELRRASSAIPWIALLVRKVSLYLPLLLPQSACFLRLVIL